MIDIQHNDWLVRAMEDAKIQTGELSELTGVSRSQIQRIRKGMPPRLDTLRKLQEALAPRIAA